MSHGGTRFSLPLPGRPRLTRSLPGMPHRRFPTAGSTRTTRPWHDAPCPARRARFRPPNGSPTPPLLLARCDLLAVASLPPRASAQLEATFFSPPQPSSALLRSPRRSFAPLPHLFSPCLSSAKVFSPQPQHCFPVPPLPLPFLPPPPPRFAPTAAFTSPRFPLPRSCESGPVVARFSASRFGRPIPRPRRGPCRGPQRAELAATPCHSLATLCRRARSEPPLCNADSSFWFPATRANRGVAPTVA